MASLKKKFSCKPMPDGAEVITRKGQRLAVWTDSKGKKQTAPVTSAADGTLRISVESSVWYCKFRNAAGRVVERSTECHSIDAARNRMAVLLAHEEKIRAGVITQKESDQANHGRDRLEKHRDAFLASMTARGCSPKTVATWKPFFTDVATALNWQTLRDLSRPELEKYLEGQRNAGRGARVCNGHITAWHAFGVWLVRAGRVQVNPFAKMLKFDERADRRRIRRALTAKELDALLTAARSRPLLEALKGNAGQGEAMKGEKAKLTPKTEDALLWLGNVRAMAYKLAVLTGLRWGELRSITIGACRLDDVHPHLILQARDEKARRGAQIPVPTGFVPELKDYLMERRARLVGDSGASVVPFPGALEGEPLFDVPENMSKVFKADAFAANLAVKVKGKGIRDGEECEVDRIDTRDSAGRCIDVHCLRHTYGTMLARSGAPLQIVQKAMRHSTPTLTAGVYVHLELMDLAGAVNAMPSLNQITQSAQVAAQGQNSDAPNTSPTSGLGVQSMAKPCKALPVSVVDSPTSYTRAMSAVSNDLQSMAEKTMARPERFELSTFSLEG